MESNKRKQLLQKYWNGQTTTAEETALRNWYHQHADGSEPELEQYFNTLTDFSEIVPHQDFKIKLPENTSVRRINKASAFSLPKLQYIAAALILTIGLSVLWQTQKTPKPPTTIASEEEIKQSYNEAKAALLLIAAKLNKGKSAVGELDKFAKTTERVRHK